MSELRNSIEKASLLASKIKLDLHLYKLNQVGTRLYIKALLDAKGIEYTELEGSIYSVRFEDRPLFVSHMDTVSDKDMRYKLNLTKNTLTRKRGILGADDKAGVNILMNHIDDINFCFTVDEEIGCLGAHALYESLDFRTELARCSCAIQYDRMGGTDLIEYCGSDLTGDIEALTHYTSAMGLWTDVSVWEDIVPAVNLSCGYYGHHTNTEYLNLREWRKAAATLPILNTKLSQSYEVPESYGYTGPVGWAAGESYETEADEYWDRYYDNHFGIKEICSHCGAKADADTDMFEENTGEMVCDECVEYIYGIKKARRY